MSSVTIRNHFPIWVLILSFVLGPFLVTQTSLAQSKDKDYKVRVSTPYSTYVGQNQEIVVRVRTRQGVPVDGVSVQFQLDPEWQGNAQITPLETTTTKKGIARANVSAYRDGGMEVKIRVDSGKVTKRAVLLFERRGGRGQA